MRLDLTVVRFRLGAFVHENGLMLPREHDNFMGMGGLRTSLSGNLGRIVKCQSGQLLADKTKKETCERTVDIP